MAMSKVREELAQQFLDALNQGQIPWHKCWSQALPMNAVTGKNYRGVNAFMLSWRSDNQGYSDPRWCTYHQAQEKGWQIRKGEKGTKVEYWACYDTKEKKLLSWDNVRQKLKADPDYEKKLQLRCRCYTVFNAEQIDGIPALQRSHTDNGGLRAQRDTLIRNMGIGYREEGIRAYYSPGMDTVTLPPEATFDDTYSYMATFLHECGHATGHESRLNRNLTGGFGSESYAREELRAEIASAFTAQSIGLQLTDELLRYQNQQHAAYLQHWASILKDSPDELFRAIKDAEEISDYLLMQGEFDNGREISGGRLGDAEYTVTPLPEGDGAELHIFGLGAIPGFDSEAERPFQAHVAAIRKVVIEDGITSVGARVLSDLSSLECLIWPRSAQGIGLQGLGNCPALKQIEFTGSKQIWHRYSPNVFLKASEKYPDLTVEQTAEVCLGRRSGLTEEQIAIYAKPEFSPAQMSSLRYCLADGLSPETLAVIADPSFSAVQMDIIRSGFQFGMTMEQVRTFAKAEIPPHEMLDTYWAIRNDPAWAPQLPTEPKEPPMVQIPEKLSLEEFLGRHGLASPIDDYMLDKHRIPHSETQRQQAQRQREAQLSSKAYHARREQAISEYKELVSQGKIVQPSGIDQKLIAARGRSENEAVQAARRSLEKRGVNWLTGSTLVEPSQEMVEAVHRWENRNLALMPEDLSTTIDPGTRQIIVRPGQCSLLIERYHEYCCSSNEQHIPPEDLHQSEDPLAQSDREFLEMDAFLKRGGDIADLADWYEKDLDMEP